MFAHLQFSKAELDLSLPLPVLSADQKMEQKLGSMGKSGEEFNCCFALTLQSLGVVHFEGLSYARRAVNNTLSHFIVEMERAAKVLKV